MKDPGGRGAMRHLGGLLLGYARVTTDAQDLTAQREVQAAWACRPSGLVDRRRSDSAAH